ncbi:MAG TPA: hypothetical protein P5055_18470, partial [Candidatus Paceibacterota bacterium]|nr:hypothetical protein [Candidatus Paceibacterota bacterium]
MKKKTLILGLCLFVLGTFAGWMAHRATTPGSKSPAPSVSRILFATNVVSSVQNRLTTQVSSNRTASAGLVGAAELRVQVGHIIQTTPEHKRREAILELADRVPLSEIPQALAEAARLTPPWRYELVNRLASRWAEADPAAATQQAMAMAPNEIRHSALNSAMRIWAQQDPAAALDWLEKQPMGDTRYMLMNALIQGVASSQPQYALDLWERSRNQGHVRHMIGMIFREWAQVDPVAAAAKVLDYSRRV